MRERLSTITGRRPFLGVFVRYGSHQPYKGPPIRTLLFRAVTTGGEVVTDHIWFKTCKTWADLGELRAGDRVSFSASVKTYTKGYRGHRDDDDLPMVTRDYKLAWPKSARLVEATGDDQAAQLRLVFDVAPTR